MPDENVLRTSEGSCAVTSGTSVTPEPKPQRNREYHAVSPIHLHARQNADAGRRDHAEHDERRAAERGWRQCLHEHAHGRESIPSTIRIPPMNMPM